jgi:4-hydroxy-tetrahydrodipicolinate synthase
MSRIQGIVPIIPTPFAEDGAVDEAGMRRVIDYVLRAGAHGVAFPAMASEFYALTERERVALTELIVHEVGGAVPVVGTATAQSPQAALELARAVAAAGVDAIMVMPPYVVRDGLPATTRLFAQMASAVDLPLIIQNAPPPLGSAYGPDVIKKLMDEVPQIAYVKEETAPGGQRITKLLSDPPAALQGVFGGAGGRYIMDELNRGAIGAMPACEVTELHVRIFDTYQSGDVDGARALYNRSLPLLTFQAVFRMDMTKEVLKRRGIIGSAHVRVGSVALDELDQAELSVLLAEIEDLLLAPALA